MAATATLAYKKHVTIEEYLRLDREENREKNGKYEFFNQKIIDLPGGTLQHGSLIANVNGLFFMKLLQTRSISSALIDTKVKSFLSYKNYVYPDATVSEGRPEYEDEKRDVLVNPLLIVEVLSTSTEGFDRGDKFQSYRNISTFKEYLLVSQYKKCIEQFYKDDKGGWHLGEVVTEGSLKLKSMDMEISIDDLYFNIDLMPTLEE